MDDMLELKNTNKIIDLDLKDKLDLNITRNNSDFVKIVADVVKNGITYAIKGLGDQKGDFSEAIESIKEIFNKKDYKKMISSAVEASVIQGLEFNKKGKNSLKDLNSFKDTAISGGLKFMISAGFDILVSKLFKGDIMLPIIQKISESLKGFLSSKSFLEKIQKGIDNIFDKAKEFKKYCQEWYNAYDKFDMEKMNEIANNLNAKKGKVQGDGECIRENEIIQNMTTLINNKRDKLSNMQLQICSSL